MDTSKLIEELERLFLIYDVNNDGVLQLEEFKHLLENSGFRFPSDIQQQIFDAVDLNNDGVIEWQEFVPAMLRVLRQLYQAEHNEGQDPSLSFAVQAMKSSSRFAQDLKSCSEAGAWIAPPSQPIEVSSGTTGAELITILEGMVPAHMSPFRLVARGQVLLSDMPVDDLVDKTAEVTTLHLVPKGQ